MRQLRYVDGDYQDDATFQALRVRPRWRGTPGALPGDSTAALRTCRQPTGQIGMRDGRASRGREAVRREPHLGPRTESGSCSAPSSRATSSESTTTSASGPCTTCCSSDSRTRCSRGSGIGRHVESVQIAIRRKTRHPGARRFLRRDGRHPRCRSEPSVPAAETISRWSRLRGNDSESLRDEKVKVLKSIPPLEAQGRGPSASFRGYRQERGVATDSQVDWENIVTSCAPCNRRKGNRCRSRRACGHARRPEHQGQLCSSGSPRP